MLDFSEFPGELVSLYGAAARISKKSEPLKMPCDYPPRAPVRVIVAKGQPVAVDAEQAIARSRAMREQLDRDPAGGRAPVVPKRGRARVSE